MAYIRGLFNRCTATVASNWQEHATFGSKSSPLGRGTLRCVVPLADAVESAPRGSLAISNSHTVGEQDGTSHTSTTVIGVDGGKGVADIAGAFNGSTAAGIEQVIPLTAGQRAPARVSCVAAIADGQRTPVVPQSFAGAMGAEIRITCDLIIIVGDKSAEAIRVVSGGIAYPAEEVDRRACGKRGITALPMKSHWCSANCHEEAA